MVYYTNGPCPLQVSVVAAFTGVTGTALVQRHAQQIISAAVTVCAHLPGILCYLCTTLH
jgi:hypothetical protein